MVCRVSGIGTCWPKCYIVINATKCLILISFLEFYSIKIIWDLLTEKIIFYISTKLFICNYGNIILLENRRLVYIKLLKYILSVSQHNSHIGEL